MAKLHFRYGTMGSSKSAQALITKFNYEERGMRVWTLKPDADTRDGMYKIKSRVGLSATAELVTPDMNIFVIFEQRAQVQEFYDVIIVDEAQFLSPIHIDQLREIVDTYNVPVFCYGLRTDFQTKLFPASMRLFEIADDIIELKTVCACGNAASVNARLDTQGTVVTTGEQIVLGGNELYLPMCYKCWKQSQH